MLTHSPRVELKLSCKVLTIFTENRQEGYCSTIETWSNLNLSGISFSLPKNDSIDFGFITFNSEKKNREKFGLAFLPQLKRKGQYYPESSSKLLFQSEGGLSIKIYFKSINRGYHELRILYVLRSEG